MSQGIPIIEAEPILARTDFGDFLIALDVDYIVRFNDPEYDYLSFFQENDNRHCMVFLGETALAGLVEVGVRELHAEAITRRELEAYALFKSQVEAGDIEEGLENLLKGI